MRKRIIFAAALCLGTMYPAYNADAATEVTQEVQQAGTIRGKVVDNNGEPVIGANIMVKGTTNGVITDIDGNFVLTNARVHWSSLTSAIRPWNFPSETRPPSM